MRFTLRTYVFRHLSLSDARLWLTGAAIAIGVASIVSLLIIADAGAALNQSPKAMFGETHMVVQLHPGANIKKVAARISAVPQVETVFRERSLPLNRDGATGRPKIHLMIVTGVEDKGGGQNRAYDLAGGRLPRKIGELALSADLADSSNLDIGDYYKLKEDKKQTSFRIVGLVADGSKVTEGMAHLYMPLSDFEARWRRSPTADRIKVVLRRPSDQGIAKKEIGKLSEIAGVRTLREFVAERSQNNLIIFTLFGLIGGIVLFVGSFLIFTTFSVTAAEREREYAILRAIGARRRQIRRVVFTEVLSIGTIFSLIGLLTGVALAYLLLWVSLKTEVIQGIAFSDLGLRPAPAAIALIAGVAATCLSAWGPARRASRTMPGAGLRANEENPGDASRRSLVGLVLTIIGILSIAYFSLTANPGDSPNSIFIGAGGVFAIFTGVALAMPLFVRPVLSLAAGALKNSFGVLGKMSALNLARTTTRSGNTATMILVGTSLVVAIATMSASAVAGGEEIVEHQVKYDLVVTGKEGMPTGVPGKTTEKIRRINGVELAGGFNLLESRITGARKPAPDESFGNDSISLVAFDPREWQRLSGLFFRDTEKGWVTEPGEQAWRSLQSDGVFADYNWAQERNIREGDHVTLVTADGKHPRFKVTALVDNFLLGSARMGIGQFFISQAAGRKYFSASEGRARSMLPGGPDLFYELMVKLKPGADRKVVQREITRLLPKGSELTVMSDKEVDERVRRWMRGPQAFLFLIFGVSIVVGLLGVVNTITIGIYGRYREIGTLRAVGASRRQLKKMVAIETTLLVLIGAAFGVLLGTVVSVVFVIGAGMTQLSFPYVFPWLYVLVLVSIIFVAALIASIYPTRLAVRLPIVDALRYE